MVPQRVRIIVRRYPDLPADALGAASLLILLLAGLGLPSLF